MAIYSRSDASSELPESQIEYRDNNGGRRWVTLIVYIIMALVVATLVVLAGRWLYHKVSNNSSPAPTTITTPQAAKESADKSPAPAPATKAPATTATPPSSSGNKAATPAPSPAPTPTATPSPAALPNNGPGEIIALFVGTSFVAAGLHFAISLRKFARAQS